MATTADECARELFDTIPPVMQALRAEVRRQRGPDLSIVQLRVLAFLDMQPGTPLSAVAEHVGLTLPSMSTHVTRLAARKLVDRAVSDNDRRFVRLRLTDAGRAALEDVRNAARASLAKSLAGLSDEERDTLMAALHTLRSTFTPHTEAEPSDNEPSENQTLEIEP